MSLMAPRSPEEAKWQEWNYGGGARRGEPMPNRMPSRQGPYEAPEKGDPYGSGGMMDRHAILSQLQGGQPRAGFGDGPQTGYGRFNGPTAGSAMPVGGGSGPFSPGAPQKIAQAVGQFAGQTNPGGQVMPQQAGPKHYGNALGWEGGKLNDASYHTPKYDLGRMVQDVGLDAFKNGSGQSRLQDMLRQNQFYKDARVDGDEIYYTGQHGQPVTIDFLKNFDAGNPELIYQTSDHGGGQAPAMAAGGNADGTIGSAVSGIANSGLLDRLRQGQIGGDAQMQDNSSIAALLKQLQDEQGHVMRGTSPDGRPI